ncbi:hypothetical protein A3I58_03365 [Candidatus Peregrinibacteria bacterium RIFCSPLOWO2_02_FULL_39_10]|nr:MAG: hypothetical protein A3I58_03365 [Candidatus Peregrinibacteria bacterium RIFCSPLOWO2_02_FULL_39_10]
MALKENIDAEDGLDHVLSLRRLLSGRLLRVSAFLTALAVAGCMQPDYKKCASSVRSMAIKCLNAVVPAFHSKVCDPKEIDGLLKVASKRCPEEVGRLDEGIPFECVTHFGSSETPPRETTVREAVTNALNDECKEVMSRPEGEGGGVVIPVIIH